MTLVEPSDVEIFDDVEQGSAAWWELKRGIPSASDFKKVLAGGDGLVRDEYMKKLAGEIVWGIQREDYHNDAMERGSEMEPYLRSWYAMMKDVDPQHIGFVRRKLKVGMAGYSPDGFIGSDGLLEIKTKKAPRLLDVMKSGVVPREHLPQCQGGLWLTERSWVDVVIGLKPEQGYVGATPFMRRIYRDEAAIKRLELAVEVFNEQLEEMAEWARRWR